MRAFSIALILCLALGPAAGFGSASAKERPRQTAKAARGTALASRASYGARCRRRQSRAEKSGTIAGAVAGGASGSVLGGAMMGGPIGAGVGLVVGRQAGKSRHHC